MDLLVRSPDGCPGNRSRRNFLCGVAGLGGGIWQGMDTPTPPGKNRTHSTGLPADAQGGVSEAAGSPPADVR